MKNPAVQTAGLSLRYGRQLALDAVSLRIEAGAIHALAGANGAGKSSLLRCLLGFEAAQQGSCHVLGCNSLQLTPAERARIAYVPDGDCLPGWLSIAQARRLQRSFYPQWRDAACQEVLSAYALDDSKRIDSLSRGERAGVCLALALAQNPELLILDEPTLGLDVYSKRNFLEALIFQRERSDMTVLYASHQVDEIERLADQLIVLDRGQIRHQGSTESLCARVTVWVTEADAARSRESALPGLLESRLIAGHAHLAVLDAPADFAERMQALGLPLLAHSATNLEAALGAMLAHKRKAERHHA